MKYSYKITKYNPSYTRERLSQEWTSFHDVDDLVSLEEYIFIENEYIRTVVELCKCLNIKSMTIRDLEIYDDCSGLSENKKIEFPEIENVIKLILREKLWCKLISKESEVHFGYDYYMYFVSSKDLSSCIKFASNKLFVEKFKSPYL